MWHHVAPFHKILQTFPISRMPRKSQRLYYDLKDTIQFSAHVMPLSLFPPTLSLCSHWPFCFLSNTGALPSQVFDLYSLCSRLICSGVCGRGPTGCFCLHQCLFVWVPILVGQCLSHTGWWMFWQTSLYPKCSSCACTSLRSLLRDHITTSPGCPS